MPKGIAGLDDSSQQGRTNFSLTLRHYHVRHIENDQWFTQKLFLSGIFYPSAESHQHPNFLKTQLLQTKKRKCPAW